MRGSEDLLLCVNVDIDIDVGTGSQMSFIVLKVDQCLLNSSYRGVIGLLHNGN